MRHDSFATPALAVFLCLQSACLAVTTAPVETAGTGASLPGTAPPAWIQTPAGDYPPQRYMTGVGSGIDPATAENRAKALIAEIFSARIESTTSIIDAERITNQGTGALFQATHQSIRTTTHKEISGVRIAENFRDENGLYWSLAVLDRRQAEKALLSQIQSLDQEIAGAMGKGEERRARAPDNRLDLAREALRIYTALQSRAALARDLGIVAAEGMTAPAPTVDLRAAERWAESALRDLRVAISGELPGDGEAISSAIVAALTALGLHVESADAPADLRIEISLTIAPAVLQDGWHWARGGAQVSLLDARAEALLQSFEVRERKSSTDEVEAGRRLVKALADKLSREMPAALVEALR